MDSQYEKVNTKTPEQTEDSNNKEEFSWRIFFRQLFVSSGTWASYFICGMFMGAPTVFIPQIRKEANSTAAVSDDVASWISSGCSYGSLPWIFVLTPLLTIIGRKLTCAFVYTGSIIITIIFYYSTTLNQLLLVEILQGLPYAGAMTVSLTVLTEYTSPKYRGMFLMMKTATLYWGIWVSNAIGTFFHWIYIPKVCLCVSLYSLTWPDLWPESPFYLASKGKFDECKKSHRWLKGTSKYAEKELVVLIDSQINRKKINFKDYFKVIIKKRFYMSILVCALCINMYFFSGKIVYTIYAVDILKRITNSESAAYNGMLILDGATVFSMYIGCYLARFVKRRTLLFISSTIGIIFLISISLYLYLVHLSVLSENKYISISLLTGFCLSISCGPVIMTLSVCGELIPFSYKSLSIIIISLIFAIDQAFLLKISPYIFKYLKMHGTFLFYAVSMLTCMLFLYKYLPETKDKTLQEIEEYFKGESNKNKELHEIEKLTDNKKC